jgi:ATP-dependent RNA helicase DeaD
VFVEKLRTTLQSGAFKPQDHLVERLLEEGFTSTDIVSALLHHLQGGDTAPVRPPPAETQPPVPAFSADSSPRQPSPHRKPRFEDRARGPRRGASEEAEAPPAAVAPPQRYSAPRRTQDSLREPQSRPPFNKLRTGPHLRAESQGFNKRKIMARNPGNPGPRQAQGEQTALPQPRSSSPTLQPSSPKQKPAARSSDYARLHLNLGTEMGIEPRDVVGAILGETGLPAGIVGSVDIRERHAFVDVISEHVHSVLAKLNRTRIKGHKFKAKVA